MKTTTNRNPLTPEIFDTFNVDYDSIENTVLIPFKSNRIQSTYEWLYGDDFSKDSMANDILYLAVQPVEGHSIHDYDGQYRYFIVSSTKLSLTGDIAISGNEITDTVAKDEKEYVQNILWNHRDATQTYFHLAEQALASEYPNIKTTRFANDIGWAYCNKQWRGVWETNDNGWLIATTNDTNSNNPQFEFKLLA